MFNKCFTVFSTVLAACAETPSEDSDILPGNLDEEVQAICNSVAGCPCECENCGPGSPIILDLSGDGFALTDAAGGVLFDLRANGRPELWAWTMAGSDDAWLALDRDGDGAITSGAELFGNHTDQPQSRHPNGYRALAVFDANGDGQIDSSDPIYPVLRLWIDTNHDGVSQPEELHTLAEFGVLSLSTAYHTQARVDGNGNVFRYRSSLTRAPESPVNHITYDVILGNANRGSAVSVTQARRRDIAEVQVLWGANGDAAQPTVEGGATITPDGDTCDLPPDIRMCRVDCYVRQSKIGADPDPENYANDTCNYVNTDICDRAGNTSMTLFFQPQVLLSCPAYGRKALAWAIADQTNDEELLNAGIQACFDYRATLASTNCLGSSGFGERGHLAYPADNACITGTDVPTMQLAITSYPWRP